MHAACVCVFTRSIQPAAGSALKIPTKNQTPGGPVPCSFAVQSALSFPILPVQHPSPVSSVPSPMTALLVSRRSQSAHGERRH